MIWFEISAKMIYDSGVWFQSWFVIWHKDLNLLCINLWFGTEIWFLRFVHHCSWLLFVVIRPSVGGRPGTRVPWVSLNPTLVTNNNGIWHQKDNIMSVQLNVYFYHCCFFYILSTCWFSICVILPFCAAYWLIDYLLTLYLGVINKRKRKGRVFIYRLFTAFSLKALRHGSHSFTCKLHHACLSFVSVHQMAPPLNVVANI